MNNRSYNVIIVDDEYLIRDLVEEKVNWAALDCEIVLKASSALEVLDYVDEHTADIIICDINMPVIDGLTLAGRLKKDNPRIKVMMLTGFDEFEYAKRGIDIGVDGYLLKPVNGDAIEEQIRNIIDKIVQEVNDKAAYDSILKQVDDDKPFIREKFLLDLIYGFITDGEMVERCDFFDINTTSSGYQLAIVEICPDKDHETAVHDNYEILYRWKLVLKEMLTAHVFSDLNKRIFILCDDGRPITAEDLIFVMKGIKDDRNYDVKMGISNMKESLTAYNEMLGEATDALNYSVIKGMNTVCEYAETGISDDRSLETTIDAVTLLAQALDKLKLYIKSGLKTEAMSIVDDIFDLAEEKMSRDPGENLSILRAEMANVISFLQQLIYSQNDTVQEKIDKGLNERGLNSYVDLNEIQSLPRAKKMVTQYIDILIGCISDASVKKNVDLIDRINEHIDIHYCESDFSLKGTAAHFYVNPDYLSRIYKKKMGLSFKDQVFGKRMEKAVELIKETDLRSYQVGEAVGIIDPNYFSVCFKKYMKMSISAYKKQLESE